MKTKEFKEQLKEMSVEQMIDMENEYREELFNLRFQLATGQLENTARIQTVRKAIARVKTALRQAENN
ncbi:MAG: 50S ribosomal protein L29 [Atopococcus tabaci]|uniref:Large ribosomal subunit protein uL29 n=1 Tax=Atopococcus tabaci TaxID=269774 RepID=A0AA43UD64_9LACT|nr:50S ribosomal protein L29 [Atopococcus tabaci]